MRKYALLNTTYATAVSFRRQAEEAYKFISSNYNDSVMNDMDFNTLFRRRDLMIRNSITLIYEHLQDNFKSTNLPFVPLFFQTANIPEIMTIGSVTLDGRELGFTNPKLNNVFVNLTNHVTYKNGDYQIPDVTTLHHLILRAALCTSYNNTDKLWLTPKMAILVIRSYNAILTTMLRNTYSINDINTLKVIGFINACFVAQQLEGEASIKEKPALVYRMNLAPAVEVDGLFNKLEDNGFSFDRKYYVQDLCDMYKKVIGDRLSTFDVVKLYKIFSTGSLDKTFAGISMEYPPYWVYQLLHIAAGGGHPTYNNIFRMTKIKNELPAFAMELNQNAEFFQSLTRG